VDDYTGSGPNSWSLSELKKAFALLGQQTALPARICFFIDGLDEFGGDHSEVVELLKSLCTNSDVKICAASRPWNVFQLAFGKTPRQMLSLQDLTRRDIEIFVRAKLEEDETFIEACASDLSYPALVDEIVAKAEGVFLWVKLAVQSLLNGIKNADTIQELRRRLKELPPELEELFAHMLDTIQDRYKEQANKIFSVVLHASRNFGLYLMSIPDDGENWQSVKSQPLKRGDVVAQLQTNWRRVNARCNGLIAPYCTSPKWTIEEALLKAEGPDLIYSLRIDFIHRSVLDFLKSKELGNSLKDDAGQALNPFHEICRTLLRPIECLISYEGLAAQKLRYSLVRPIVTLGFYARKSQDEFSSPETDILVREFIVQAPIFSILKSIPLKVGSVIWNLNGFQIWNWASRASSDVCFPV
jgi:hypothetical protein